MRTNFKAPIFEMELSPLEFANAGEIPLNPKHRGSTDIESTLSPGWSGCANLSDAHEIFTGGWQAGADKIAAVVAELGDIPAARSTKRRVRFADTGGEIEIDRAMAGEPEMFRTSRAEQASGQKVIDVYALFGGSCGKSEDQIFWCGAAAAVIVDILENAGYAVRVVGSMLFGMGRGSSQFGRIDVALKEESEPLRLDFLAATIAHRASFRALGFRAMHAIPGDTGAYGWWPDGIVSQARATMAEHGRDYPEDSIVIGQTYDRRSALEAIRNVIARVQGEVSPTP